MTVAVTKARYARDRADALFAGFPITGLAAVAANAAIIIVTLGVDAATTAIGLAGVAGRFANTTFAFAPIGTFRILREIIARRTIRTALLTFTIAFLFTANATDAISRVTILRFGAFTWTRLAYAFFRANTLFASFFTGLASFYVTAFSVRLCTEGLRTGIAGAIAFFIATGIVGAESAFALGILVAEIAG